ncbi:hypothetical protein [Sinomonas sp. G460-2]|uniref:hypothetical protein n=1 Tax=Sinomonas sp. G460-2 TaxID=3393464 RepID=UPI0039EFB7C9
MNPFGQCGQELAYVRLHGPASPNANRHRKIGEVEAVEGKPPVELARAGAERVCKVTGTIPDAPSAVQARAGDPPGLARERDDTERAQHLECAASLTAGVRRTSQAAAPELRSL